MGKMADRAERRPLYRSEFRCSTVIARRSRSNPLPEASLGARQWARQWIATAAARPRDDGGVLRPGVADAAFSGSGLRWRPWVVGCTERSDVHRPSPGTDRPPPAVRGRRGRWRTSLRSVRPTSVRRSGIGRKSAAYSAGCCPPEPGVMPKRREPQTRRPKHAAEYACSYSAIYGLPGSVAQCAPTIISIGSLKMEERGWRVRNDVGSE